MNTTDPPTGTAPALAAVDSPRPPRIRPKVISRLNTRRQAIKDIYARCGPYTTVREVVRHLNEAGIKASLGSTHRDRVFLGLAG